MKRNGTGSFWGVEATWEVVQDLADHLVPHLVPAVVVRVTFAGDDRPMWVACEPGDPPRPLCRHEHLHAGSVLCPEQRFARDELDRLERVRRIGAMPAPEGAKFVTHCESYWRASLGGACPACGVVGVALAPVVKLARADRLGGWWVNTELVSVRSALEDVGLADAHCVRVLDHTAALVENGALPRVISTAIGGYLAHRLEGAGWTASAGGRRSGAA